MLAELSTPAFFEERRNVLLLGPPGGGHDAPCPHRARHRRHPGPATAPYFATAADLVAGLRSSHLEGSASAKMRTFTGPSVLAVDELGSLPIDADLAHRIFQVVSRRYKCN